MIQKTSRLAWILAAAAIMATLVALLLTAPLSFGLAKRGLIGAAVKGDGYGWVAPLPTGLKTPLKRSLFFPQDAWVLENGVRLDNSQASQKAIERAGWGRSRVQSGKVYFSTSDRQDLQGRTYEVVTPSVRAPEAMLFVAWTLATALWAACLRIGSVNQLRDRQLVLVGAALGSGLIIAMIVARFWTADRLLLGLGAPLIWAVACALLATARRGAAVWVLGLLAILPAVATWIYYVVNQASHGAFLVAGVLPMSDAWVHFQQAAQIARQGVTEVPFNGRFLYPAYFSGILWLSGWNLGLANALTGSVGLLMLGFTLWCWRSRLGVAGTALLGLLSWLYFREFGSGLVMTETLGFTCGMLGVTCLFLGVEQRRISLLLLGVLWLSLGSSARPGALFALPLVGLSVGWLAWRWSSETGARRAINSALIVAAAAVLVIGSLALNQVMIKALYPGKVAAFGNFSYTLNGLLTGTNWQKSYDEMQGDSGRIMAENIRLIKEDPTRLAKGVGRAYVETWEKSFLYRFGPDRRLARGMMWLGLLGLAAFWFVPGLRHHAPWVWAGALGVVLSIPFAPPWDAEVRPYAVTVGLQNLLPAAGLTGVLWGLGRLIGWRSLDPLPPGNLARRISQSCSAILILLIIVLPLGRSMMARQQPIVETSTNPVWRTGSLIVVGPSASEFQKRLAPYVIEQGTEAGQRFESLPAGTTLGIDWRDLQIKKITP